MRRRETGSCHRYGKALPFVLSVAIALACGPAASAQTTITDLAHLTLEDLMNIEITSVSKRAQRVSDAAAAVYVLTNADIRRSGATTIPDVLRLVPGLHVGQIDSNKWSVSARGFGGRFANKLLVLVDGRSVYTPLFSGVFWNLVDVPLEDVERIEIVRGPGATLWGANAVNGVINVITRTAAASKGGRATVGLGTEERASGSLRYGGGLGANGSYRVDARSFRNDGSAGVVPGAPSDKWWGSRGGFRMDWQPREGREFMLQGALVDTLAHEMWSVPSLYPPYQNQVGDQSHYTSGFMLGQWTARTPRAETTFRLLGEQTSFHEQVLDERRHTLDLDVQHTRQVGSMHELIWGGMYRLSTDRTVGTPVVVLDPARRTLTLGSGFVQDEMKLLAGNLRVTLGSKFEHNDYTGWEVQPNVRSLLALSSRQSIWGAVSRAVRLPSRAESDGRFYPSVQPPSGAVPLPQVLMLRHDEGPTMAEVLVAYEGGYRSQALHSLSFDVSGFVNSYQGLGTNRLGIPHLEMGPVPYLEVPVLFGNLGHQNFAGAEFEVEWQPPVARLRLNGGYSYFVAVGQPSTQAAVAETTDDYPNHQVHLRGAINLPRRVEVDATARYVSALPKSGVPSYLTADARVGIRLGLFDVAIVGRDLLTPTHSEYLPDVLGTALTKVQRSASLRVTWHF